MDKLREIVAAKPYFIWTSNIDHHFALAEFNNLLEIEGELANRNLLQAP
ncbi:hypothetical protein [Limosilactobacillus panis]|uniref:Uncharacterized protein n=1 Tax=Limosilactobacillus panis TaxID=47493 RepID=A0ABT7VLR0_9LACO|nr:hypothetical protein [Limosilactobacillus panis]MDM8333668.1 hypothetical protein [Limosilactobacillus panis]